MNEQARNNRYFASAKEFKTTISNFFVKTVPKTTTVLESRTTDNFQNLEKLVF